VFNLTVLDEKYIIHNEKTKQDKKKIMKEERGGVKAQPRYLL